MILASASISAFPHEAVLAHFIMSSKETDTKGTFKKKWNTGGSSKKKTPALFQADEMDIYCNKVTKESYIFHSKTIDYQKIDHLEYDADDYSVDVVMKDSSRMDLGVKIQWLVRPWFSKAPEIFIVQTKDGESINGAVVPLLHKSKENNDEPKNKSTKK